MFDSPLRITPLGPSRDEARLDDFLWRGERADFAVWLDRGGDKLVVRSRTRRGPDGVLSRLRVRSIVEDDAPRELDRTTFELHPNRFVERVSASVDAPARSIELPATLARGAAITPEGEASQTITLLYVGPVKLEVAGVEAERTAALLRLGGASGWDQWMVEGVGEVSLGPAGQLPHRWLVAWRAGDHSDLLFAAPRG
ncbi:MAG: hypothetical protein KDA24_04275 [Deltaproteobacteria bacterium]|nr:hypothetical protein [Deltaproteobacteria bacterium]